MFESVPEITVMQTENFSLLNFRARREDNELHPSLFTPLIIPLLKSV